MTLPVVFTANGPSGYNLTKSLRFRSSASAYLNRTPSSTTGRQVLTISFWCKRGKLGASQNLVYASDAGASNYSYIFFNSSDQLNFATAVSGVNKGEITTNAVFRDPSAWYHIVLSLNFATPTATIYVNGVSQSVTINTALSASNLAWLWTGATNFIGSNVTPANFLDGYMAEVNFIDGQALTPSSFGETSTTTGVWIPKKYTGTYGTNGFYLPFTDTTSTSTLGTDFSGNSNTWTVNNISLTSGSTYDSMNDVPTNTSATTANYCTLNPLDSTLTLINANLSWNAPSNTELGSRGTIGVSSGKWYYEYKITSTTANPFSLIGWASQSQNNNSVMPTGVGSSTWAYYPNDFKTYNNGTASSVYGVTGSANDIIMVALDLDNSRIYWGRNGTWFNSGNPATQTNPAYTNVSGTLFPWIQEYNQTSSANFGQQPFSYTPPTGFVALNTFNLPTPTIGATASSQANKYFDINTYTGDGSQTASFTNSGSMQPDLVWSKIRSGTTQGIGVFDSVRGTTGQSLDTSATTVEGTWVGSNASDYGYVSAFNSNGFSVNDGAIATTGGYVNFSGRTYVAWQWRASNATAVTNTAGSITSTVSANTTAGFSIVTYTGNATAGATIGHGLGVTPAMFMVKSRSLATGWNVYHQNANASPASGVMTLQTTDAFFANSAWNSTTPTSSVFSVGGTGFGVNNSGETYVAYCFAQITGYSAFGSYTGNGSTDGTFVFTGFRPRWILIKVSSGGTGSWILYDTARNTYNVSQSILYPNLSDAEATTSSANLDILSNGFKLRTSNADFNGSTFTYIYACFAENPFKYANAR